MTVSWASVWDGLMVYGEECLQPESRLGSETPMTRIEALHRLQSSPGRCLGGGVGDSDTFRNHWTRISLALALPCRKP